MSDLEDVLFELDRRIRELEELPYPAVRDQIFDVLQLVDLAHRPGLNRLSEMLEAAGLRERALEDESIRLLLTLYDLAPLAPEQQADLALELVRPYIRSHGGEVEVLRVEEGAVHVRLSGACGSCSASPATLAHGVQTALAEGFAGFTELVVHDPQPPAGASAEPGADAETTGLVQIGAPIFTAVTEITAPEEGVLRVVTVSDRRVLIVGFDGAIQAFEPTCPTCGASLADGKLSGMSTGKSTAAVILCPFQNCAFDAATGRRADGMDEPGLKAYPAAIENGRILVAAATAPTEVLTP